MTKFRLANPCQNKESKQKKHDKRDKRNANGCFFNTSLCSETWQTPLKGIHNGRKTFDMLWRKLCLLRK